jgi:hypothetical protein
MDIDGVYSVTFFHEVAHFGINHLHQEKAVLFRCCTGTHCHATHREKQRGCFLRTCEAAELSSLLHLQCQNSSKLLNVKNSGQVQEEGQEEDQYEDPDSVQHELSAQRGVLFQALWALGIAHKACNMNMGSLGC